MQDPITLKSGAILTIGIAPFSSGTRLLKTVAAELARVQIDFDLSSLQDIGSKDINTLKNAILQLLASDAVEAALMKCAEKSHYNSQTITAETFTTETARVDYLPVMVEVMKANLRPFFSGLDLAFLTSPKANSESPASR